MITSRSLFIPAFQILCISASTAETFPAANGLERSLVAREPLLQNPVSVAVDVDGSVYVTETTRRKAADLDIREFAKHGWIPHDVSLTSVADRLAFLEKELTPGKFDSHPSLKDHNKDGVVDIKDLTAFSEKIIRLTDNSDDGVMDTKTVFAEGFNSVVTGIAAGVFAWRGDVYTTIAPDFWKLRDTTGDGRADERKSLVHGFGNHIAYAGHDMHGITWGPDGRIYWSIGDKGTNVTTGDGKNHYAPHEGAVLRVFPDGSGFEIFARGLRNPQEIAFNHYGDMFSVDNDADLAGERERFVHITEGSDTGWRNYYQYRGSDYNPWMEENLWQPDGPNQPAYITPTPENYSDGPAGFAFNPGTALNDRYHNSFFVTEFPKGNLRSFKVEPDGATFKITDDHIVLSGPMNVGIQFGPDGGLYTADWSGGYPLNNKGAVWKLDDPSQAKTAIREEVAALLKKGPSKATITDLVKQLAHPDQRIRLDAQWELASRQAKDELHQVILGEKQDQFATIHALWALSQTGDFSEKTFARLVASKDAELRAQAAKHAGETSKEPVPGLISLLSDGSPRVRFHAATAVWKLRMNSALDATITMLAENNNDDDYLRHAGALALSGMDMDQVAAKTVSHENAAVRLAAAVAFRRTSSSHAEKLLLDSDPQVVAEAARAIYDEPSIQKSFPALAELLFTKPGSTVPALRRSIAANRHLGDEASASRLTSFATEPSYPAGLRAAALQAIASWPVAFSTDPVDGRHHPFAAAPVEAARKSFATAAPALQQDPDEAVATAAATAAKAFDIVADEKTLAAQAADTRLESQPRLRAMQALSKVSPVLFNEAAGKLLTDKSPAVRSGTAAVLVKTNPEAVIAYARQALASSNNIPERQQVVGILAGLDSAKAADLVSTLLKQALASPAKSGTGYDPALLLELIEASESKPLIEKLETLGEIGPHLPALHGGDPALGKKVFNEHLAAQCIACHRIGKEGSNVGPPLTGIGNKNREHILESLVLPQAEIAPGYGLMSVTKKDGSSIAGAFKEETPAAVTLILPDLTEVAVATADIATRTQPVSTMPPMGVILNPRELRDLVAYLAELK